MKAISSGEVPAQAAASHRPAPAQRGLARDDLPPVRVLVADDYADAAASLALLLFSAGFETEVALDGEQALMRASSWRPEVCVLDISMPGLDGREIARSIRAQCWDERPLLIAVTGWTSAESRRSALDAGFDYYFMKPVDPTRLVRLIASYDSGLANPGSPDHSCF